MPEAAYCAPRPVLLEVSDLAKTYCSRGYLSALRLRAPTQVQALRGVSFSLQAGQVAALLGPNGAGKTTLINILCDLTRADRGNVSMAGVDVLRNGREARRHLGYASTNDRSFIWRLTGRQNLEFYAALHGCPPREAARRATQMLERFNLAAHGNRLFHTYSAGMKKRLGLARAFLHDPDVLLLDEPTTGLDALSTEEFIEMVRQEIGRSGKAVLWATHRADEIERLCNRVLVLIGGRLHFDGSSDDFLDISRRHMGFCMHLSVPPARRAEALAEIRARGLEVFALRQNGDVHVTGSGDERGLSSVITAMIAAGTLVKQVERRAEPLHKVFVHLEKAGY
ncbi:MAG TPA: ABC transporter ATP-binding protein [Usitatibacter sp.]|nr:ABC transporter ATP-binding protein [Usitatibacter sp.]